MIDASSAAPAGGARGERGGATATEFRVAGSFVADHRSANRWVWSHVRRSPGFVFLALFGTLLTAARNAGTPLLIGAAVAAVTADEPDRDALILATVGLAVVNLLGNAFDVLAAYSFEFLGKRLERQARDELAVSLLGKSQTFHNRQRVGDVMARATNDVRIINSMMSPGFSIVVDSVFTVVVLTASIAWIDWRLAVAPLAFLAFGGIALRRYVGQIAPVTQQQRERFGIANAGLNESVGGIETVKGAAQEDQEARKFLENATRVRDLQVKSGRIQARYLPLLVLTVCTVGGAALGFALYADEQLGLGELTAFIGLMVAFRVPAGLSVWTLNLIQLGLSGARRIIELIVAETELDERPDGHAARITGRIVFDRVTFGYGDSLVLDDVSFTIEPGETVAIVGQTGAGKTTLTRLVNRTYDVSGGRITVDGVDVRDWNLDSLRSQIGAIEQDVFLFSRTVKENIAFGAPAGVTDEEIVRAAREAQSDGFIRGFKDGYETVVGERGVTLSGGQRQRLAIARALLTDPRILILDDATSAIDSATEDEIQTALRRVQSGRSTLLITHRLSQIRWSDKVLVVDRGKLIDHGTHDELLDRCRLYRRIFQRYGPAPEPSAPPAVVETGATPDAVLAAR